MRHSTVHCPQRCAEACGRLGAEEAYAECVRTDHITAALRAAVTDGMAAPALEAELEKALAAAPKPPAMPETRALLRDLPAHGDFPGAQYRLAGDRCAAQTRGVPLAQLMSSNKQAHRGEQQVHTTRTHILRMHLSHGSCLPGFRALYPIPYPIPYTLYQALFNSPVAVALRAGMWWWSMGPWSWT